MNCLSREKRRQIIHLMVEGNTVNGIERLTGASKHTILRLLGLRGGFTFAVQSCDSRFGKHGSAMALFTFGYEGLAIDGFIARLKKAGVAVVVDVRELPLSRKKGFSKRAFAKALNDAGIAYTHVPVFGCPKPIRNQYKIDGNWRRYEKAFNAYLATKTPAVADLATFSKTAKACLVCFEADFNFCHRSLVARAAADAGGAGVIHLTATAEIAGRSAALAA